MNERRASLTATERRARTVEYLPLNWFAAVMGTAILAVAGAMLTSQFAGLPTSASVVWAPVAGAITVHTAAKHLPFSLTWPSFTLPVGTCVTGTSALAQHTCADLFRWAAAGFYLRPVGARLQVGARTTAAIINVVAGRPAPCSARGVTGREPGCSRSTGKAERRPPRHPSADKEGVMKTWFPRAKQV